MISRVKIGAFLLSLVLFSNHVHGELLLKHSIPVTSKRTKAKRPKGTIKPQRTQLPKENAPLAASAKAALLVAAKNLEKPLFAKNVDERLSIASLTKIMTALIVLENISDLDELVTISPADLKVEPSIVHFQAGEKIPVRSLLYGLMLKSGNDAALALARHTAKDVPTFVALMNTKAAELGLANTHFANPHGLDDPKNYSTAMDLAKLTATALENEIFQEIVSSSTKTVPWPSATGKRTFKNKNRLLLEYPGTNGVKTGFTGKAKRTLVTSANINNTQYIAVTLGDTKQDWQNHKNLFNLVQSK
ncbi:MAG: hypothetical protein RLZ12_983 [Bacillota bacterium]|jgi:D-alanyl-D-alanine carboxypeptidase